MGVSTAWKGSVCAALGLAALGLLSAGRARTPDTRRTAPRFFVRERPPSTRFPSEANRLDAQGLEALAEGRNEDANAVFTRSLGLFPDNPRALANRGTARLGLGRAEDAWRDYSLALELEPSLEPVLAPSLARVRYERGKRRVDAGNLGGALVELREAVRLDGASGPALSELGFVHLRLGRPAEAADLLDRSVEAAPEWAEGWANRAAARYALGRARDALADLDRAIELDPGLAEAYASRAGIRYARGERTKARADAARAAALKPELGPSLERILGGGRRD